LPDVPTLSDFVPGFEATAQFGIGAPQKTPDAVIATLNREINAALAEPAIKARLSDLAGAVLTGSPADYGGVLADETDKWAKVIRAGNIKPE
jgi:tripartite-type tricarboxylate transporter receptor subunit TctC